MKVFGGYKAEQDRLVLADLLWPHEDLSDCQLLRQHALLIDKQGCLQEHGRAADLLRQYPSLKQEVYQGVLAPAFADAHLHWVQHGIMGRYHLPLLEWLEKYAFPAEAVLKDQERCQQAAKLFWHDLIKSGTFAGLIYGSSFQASVDECLRQAVGLYACGASVMTQNAPPILLQSPEQAFHELQRTHAYWQEAVAVTPRYALSLDAELMQKLGLYAREHGLVLQTHLAENQEEVGAVLRAYPEAKSYTELYDRLGLLYERTVLAHCIYLDDWDFECLRQRNCFVAHCPSSNMALGSGRMKLEKIREHGVDWMLASDIGAGPSLCMFDVIKAFLKLQKNTCDVKAGEAFARATVFALPQRFLPDSMPAFFNLLPEALEGEASEEYLLRLLTQYQRGKEEETILKPGVIGLEV